jgi:hypothetical protein
MTVRDTHDKHGPKLGRTDSVGAGASAAPSRVLSTGKPRTALGQRLMNIRVHILASGEPRLDWDAIEKEIAERRGGSGEQGQELGE